MDIFELFKKIAKESTPTGAPSFIIAGLGNPGREYEATRHNAGFMAVDFIAEKAGVQISKNKFSALTAIGTVNEKSVLLLKPQTYMNNSGVSISEAASFYKIKPENIIVLVDDIYLPPGKIRIRKSGSAGGHNGISSIIASLGSDSFPRIRIGVGEKPKGQNDLAAWVLGKLPVKEMLLIKKCFSWSAEASEYIISGKINDAMGIFNGKTAVNDNE